MWFAPNDTSEKVQEEYVGVVGASGREKPTPFNVEYLVTALPNSHRLFCDRTGKVIDPDFSDSLMRNAAGSLEVRLRAWPPSSFDVQGLGSTAIIDKASSSNWIWFAVTLTHEPTVEDAVKYVDQEHSPHESSRYGCAVYRTSLENAITSLALMLGCDQDDFHLYFIGSRTYWKEESAVVLVTRKLMTSAPETAGAAGAPNAEVAAGAAGAAGAADATTRKSMIVEKIEKPETWPKSFDFPVGSPIIGKHLHPEVVLDCEGLSFISVPVSDVVLQARSSDNVVSVVDHSGLCVAQRRKTKYDLPGGIRATSACQARHQEEYKGSATAEYSLELMEKHLRSLAMGRGVVRDALEGLQQVHQMCRMIEYLTFNYREDSISGSVQGNIAQIKKIVSELAGLNLLQRKECSLAPPPACAALNSPHKVDNFRKMMKKIFSPKEVALMYSVCPTTALHWLPIDDLNLEGPGAAADGPATGGPASG